MAVILDTLVNYFPDSIKYDSDTDLDFEVIEEGYKILDFFGLFSAKYIEEIEKQYDERKWILDRYLEHTDGAKDDGYIGVMSRNKIDRLLQFNPELKNFEEYKRATGLCESRLKMANKAFKEILSDDNHLFLIRYWKERKFGVLREILKDHIH